MERIYGVPVTDMQGLKDQGTNMKLLAERGVETFFTQVFRDSFFHADMHPGNIFVSFDHPEDPKYIGIDCGIVGSLTPEDQSYLARNLLAFFRRDYRLVAKLHIDSGWVPPDTRVNELEGAIRTVCEPIFEKPLAEISFGMVLLNLFQVARRFNMEVQPQLVLLQKTLLNIEGLGRQLYPQLDLWETAQPFLENWMKDRVAPTGVLKRLHHNMPELIEQAPFLIHQIVEEVQGVRAVQEKNSGRRTSSIRQLAVPHSWGCCPCRCRLNDTAFERCEYYCLGSGIARNNRWLSIKPVRYAGKNSQTVISGHGSAGGGNMSDSWLKEVTWDSNGLVPAIAQDADTGKVLMMAWMNREALEATVREGHAIYWSRSRQRLWRKGESSGHAQELVDLRLDCDGDTILLKVRQHGGIACHTGREHCFFKQLQAGDVTRWEPVEPVIKSPDDIYL